MDEHPTTQLQTGPIAKGGLEVFDDFPGENIEISIMSPE
jgi:hypothetical protein